MKQFLRAALSFLTLVALTACGGGGGASGTSSNGVPPPGASSNAETVTLQAQTTTAALPAVGGNSGTISLPPGTGMMTITSALQPPAGIPAPSGITPLMYISFSAMNNAVAMAGTPGFTMDMSGMMSSANYYMAEYMNGAWATVEGPGTMMSGTQMMMGTDTTPISLQAGEQACFAYYSGSPVGSPTAAPSMMP